MHVIEYQWRGLPHFHMAVRLKDTDTDNRDNAIQFIDEFIRAELPTEENCSHMSSQRFEAYKKLVQQHMYHCCAQAVNGCKQKEDDICKRGYDRSETIPITSIDDRGFIVYRRRRQEDLKIKVLTTRPCQSMPTLCLICFFIFATGTRASNYNNHLKEGHRKDCSKEKSKFYYSETLTTVNKVNVTEEIYNQWLQIPLNRTEEKMQLIKKIVDENGILMADNSIDLESLNIAEETMSFLSSSRSIPIMDLTLTKKYINGYTSYHDKKHFVLISMDLNLICPTDKILCHKNSFYRSLAHVLLNNFELFDKVIDDLKTEINRQFESNIEQYDSYMNDISLSVNNSPNESRIQHFYDLILAHYGKKLYILSYMDNNFVVSFPSEKLLLTYEIVMDPTNIFLSYYSNGDGMFYDAIVHLPKD
jgi:hypothetical protein